jgi:hypothetical protein
MKFFLVGDKIIEHQPKKSSHKTEGKFAAALNVFFTILLHYHDQKIIYKKKTVNLFVQIIALFGRKLDISQFDNDK